MFRERTKAQIVGSKLSQFIKVEVLHESNVYLIPRIIKVLR